MNREIKVALGLLVCLVGLIVFMEFSGSNQPEGENDPNTETQSENIASSENELDSEVSIDTSLTSSEENTTSLDSDIASSEETSLDTETVSIDTSESTTTETESSTTLPEEGTVVAALGPSPSTGVSTEESHEGDGAGEREAEAFELRAPRTAQKFPKVYIVQKGDTLSEISKDLYGSTRHMKQILAKNPELEANRIFPGIRLSMPSESEIKSFKKEAVTFSKNHYRIQKGDTLFSISRKHFGNDAKVKEIIKLNPSVNPQKLIVGQHLLLPKQ